MQVSLPWLHTLHGKPDELPYMLNILDNQAYARSPDCTRFMMDPNNCCSPCATLVSTLTELGKSVKLYPPHTRHSLKNVLQLSQIIDECHKELEH